MLNRRAPSISTDRLSADFNYVVLCGAELYDFLRQTLFSIQKNFTALPTLYVFVDFGTPDTMIKKISTLYPADKLHVITAEACLKYHEKESAGLKEFARKNVMGLKLAALLQVLDQKKPVLYTDTDVLWLNNPTDFISGLIANTQDMHMSYDYDAGYDQDLINKANLHILMEPPYYCAGIMFFNRLTAQNRILIDELLPIVVEKSGHSSEQTIFAFIQKTTGVSDMTPDKFVLEYNDQFSVRPDFKPERLARHYVGSVRHLFWRDAFFKKLWKFNIKQHI